MLQNIHVFASDVKIGMNDTKYKAGKESSWTFKEYKPLPAPDDIEFFDQDKGKHYLEEYEGKTLLVVFWASWCAPCAQEMRDLDILQKDFRKLPFEILAISEDYQNIKMIQEFYKLYDIRHMQILYDYRNQLFNAFGVIGMPTSFLITADGMNIGSFSGIVPWHDDSVRNILTSHILGNPPEPKNTSKTRSLNQIVPTQKEMKQNEQSQKNKE